MIRLLFRCGNESRELEFTDDVVTLGRSSKNKLKVEDKNASRMHARIEKIGLEYRVSDLESANGTQVNGKNVTFHTLAGGDEITIGQASFLVLHLDGPGRPAPAPQPVAAAAAAAPVASAPVAVAPPPVLTTHTQPPAALRSVTARHFAWRSESSIMKSLVTLVLAVAVIGGLVYGLMYVANQKKAPAMARETKDGPAASAGDADDALKAWRGKVDPAEAVTDAMVDEGVALGQRFAPLYPSGDSPFDKALGEIRQKRSDQFKGQFGDLSARVDTALVDRRYGDAMESLRSFRASWNKGFASEIEPLTLKASQTIQKDFKEVDEAGRKLEEEKRFEASAQHYRAHTARFQGTEHFKYLSLKPENLALMAKLDLEASLRPAKPAAEVALKPAPAPEPEKPAPEPSKPVPAPKAMAKEPPKEPAKPMVKEAPKALPKEIAPPKPASSAKAAKEPKGPKPEGAVKLPDATCKAEKTVKGAYCLQCKRTLGPDDMRNMKCKKCDEAPKKIDMCIKRQYEAACHPEKKGEKPVS